MPDCVNIGEFTMNLAMGYIVFVSYEDLETYFKWETRGDGSDVDYCFQFG